MTTQQYGKYIIETGIVDRTGAFYAKVYNDNAKKEYNRLKHYYIFNSENLRDKYIEDFIENVKGWEDIKADRKVKRIAFKNPAKVGDILSCSWGYDQTNVDFYQVVKVSGKCVYIQEIGGHSLDSVSDMADHVKPNKNAFVIDAPVLKRLVKEGYSGGYYVGIASYSIASITNPEDSPYRSWS